MKTRRYFFNKSLKQNKEFLYHALVTAFVIGLFLTAFLKAGVPGKIETYSVRTGSMEPIISKGSLVWVKKADNYQPGEVITFGFQKNSKNNPDYQTITHQIVKVIKNGREVSYLTKGEANQAIDGDIVRHEDIRGKAVLTVPFLGKLVDLTDNRLVYLVLIMIPSLVVTVREIRRLVFLVDWL